MSKTCQYCAEEIKDDARICPHCHKSTASMGKKLLIGAIVGLIIGLITWLSHAK